MGRSSAHWRGRADVRVVATIEARMTSTRLPGKVLAPVAGAPMLELMLGRLARAQTLAGVCVATTVNPDDDPIVACAAAAGVSSFRGSENDVLDRVLGAAVGDGADVIVELTADCPFVDPGLVDACVLAYLAGDVHYCSNALERSYPLGLDVKVFATDVLAEVASLTDAPEDREHVSLYIYEHPERYRLLQVPAVGPLARPEWRWTVDTAADLQFVRAVVDALGVSFSASEASRFLDAHPEIVALNEHVDQKPVR